jgi:hypothetical protein
MITRRLFGGLLTTAATALSRTSDFAKEKILRIQVSDSIDLVPGDRGIRRQVWMKIRHDEMIRFEIGTPGQEILTSGMIQPSQASRTTGRNYGVGSVMGLSAATPLRVTLRSRKPFTLVSRQEIFDRPYRLVNTPKV